MVKQSANQILERRKNIRTVLDKMTIEGQTFTLKNILEQCKTAGIKAVSLMTVQRDLIEINKSNTWIEDIAESEYSAIQEDIFKKTLYIEHEALTLYRKEWQISTVRKKQTPKGEINESTLQKNEAGPKAAFLRIALDCQKVKQESMKGDNVQLSVAMLGKKLNNLREELNLVTKERDKLKEQHQ